MGVGAISQLANARR